MIRKVSPQGFLFSGPVARNFGGWDAVYRARAASASRAKAMQVFKQQRVAVPLQPKQRRNPTW